MPAGGAAYRARHGANGQGRARAEPAGPSDRAVRSRLRHHRRRRGEPRKVDMSDTKNRRALTRDAIMSLADYGKVRRERRQAVTELKKRRRIEVGPFATFYFENYETMLQQIQEMLHVEKGGEAQLADEL